MLMFMIGARWSEPEKSKIRLSSGLPTQQRTVTVANLWTSAACFAALVALPHVALWATDRGEGHEPVIFSPPMTLAPDWLKIDRAIADFKPAFENPSAEMNNSYTHQSRTVGLYLGYYRHQDYNRKLVSSNNGLVVSKDPRWAQVTSGKRTATFAGQEVSLRTAELRGTSLTESTAGDRLTVLQIYWINGTLTSSDYIAKAYSALYRLMGRGDDSAVIVVYAPKDQAGGAEAALENFLSANYTAINEFLLKARGKQ